MLTSLQTLPYFAVHDEEGRRIAELGSLKNLKRGLIIYNLENVQGEEDSKKAYLFQKSGIDSLVLCWDTDTEGEMNDADVLKGLQPHSNLKILEIYGFQGSSFPSWTLKMARFDNLINLVLAGCVKCEEIPKLGHLPRLKYQYLSYQRNAKHIVSSFYGIDKCSSSSSNNGVWKERINVFPALECLTSSGMPNLTEWVEVEILSSVEMKVFPCLKYLMIEDCHELMSAPSQFPFLREFDIPGMYSGSPLANTCGIKLTSLAELRISGVEELVRLPDWLFHNNQNLTDLEIWKCTKLRELPDGLHSLNFLEKLSIKSCPDLKSIPYSSGRQSQGLTSLRRLSIMDCQGLMNLPSEMVDIGCKAGNEYANGNGVSA